MLLSRKNITEGKLAQFVRTATKTSTAAKTGEPNTSKTKKSKDDEVASSATSEGKMRKAVSEFIVKELRASGVCKLHGFGNFVLKSVPERERRNPKTGEVVLCPPSLALRFSASKKLTESFNAKTDGEGRR